MIRHIILLVFMNLVVAMPLLSQQVVKRSPILDNNSTKVSDNFNAKVNINFKGGSIQDLLDQVRNENDVHPNVVISPEAMNIILPPINLKSVSIDQIMIGIEKLGSLNEYELGVTINPGIISVRAYHVSSRKAIVKRPPSLRIFCLKPLLEMGYKVEDIVTALETAFAMSSEDGAAKLKYHSETALLIVNGYMNHLVAMENIMDSLSRAQSVKKVVKTDLAKKVEKLQTAVVELKDMNALLMKKIEDLEKSKK